MRSDIQPLLGEATERFIIVYALSSLPLALETKSAKLALVPCDSTLLFTQVRFVEYLSDIYTSHRACWQLSVLIHSFCSVQESEFMWPSRRYTCLRSCTTARPRRRA